jgi:hypothetical protein
MTAPRLRWWWAMAPIVLAGVLWFGFDRVRLAGFVVAGGIGLGALLRLVLPTARSGGLAVRSRFVDVLTMAVLAVALAAITALLDLRPRG